MFSQQFLKGPFLDVLSLVLLELRDELDGAREYAAFVLLATRNDLLELVDAFVDRFTPASLNCASVRYAYGVIKDS